MPTHPDPHSATPSALPSDPLSQRSQGQIRGITAAQIRERATALAPAVTRLRHELHQWPEIGLHLPRTQQSVVEWLRPLPLEISTGESLSSVTAVLRSTRADVAALPQEHRPVVLLRGDMDGLPITESSGVPYASRTPDTMHACGHDQHTAILAGTASLLADSREHLHGDVVFMFQPGEEGFDGAGHMIREGVLEAAGTRADAAYGLHVLSGRGPSGQFSAKPGTLMSASDSLVVTIRGAGGHGSAPHAAKDPVPALAAIATALHTLVTREFDVFDPVVITVGVLRAGTAKNIIPETGQLEATIRSLSVTSHTRLRSTVPRLVMGIAQAHGVEAEVQYRNEYPMTVNDARHEDFLEETVHELFGAESYERLEDPLSGSEDFSRVLAAVPGAFVFLSATDPALSPSDAPYNHSPGARFHDSVMPRGVALLSLLAMRRLEAISEERRPGDPADTAHDSDSPPDSISPTDEHPDKGSFQ